MIYKNRDHDHFVRDMEEAGFEIDHEYHGRFFWVGPSVIMEEPTDCKLHTNVACQYDSHGLQYVVYPQAYNESSLKKLKRYYEEEGYSFLYAIANIANNESGIVIPTEEELKGA